MTPAERDALVLGHMPLARQLAVSFARRTFWCWRDEFESAAMLGLVEAAIVWDPARSAFGPHANGRIRCRLVDAWRNVVRYRRESPLDDRHDSATAGDADAALDSADAFEALIRPAPALERDLLRRVYRDGMTPAEAGRAMGLEENHAREIHRLAVAALKQHMEICRA